MIWVWANEHRLYIALDKVSDRDELDDLLDALDEVLADPYGGAASHMRGTSRTVDRWILPLPHGWVLVYTPYPAGIPPQSKPMVLVRDLIKMFD